MSPATWAAPRGRRATSAMCAPFLCPETGGPVKRLGVGLWGWSSGPVTLRV